MKEILVTGGSGFIGAEIVNQLHSIGGWDITVLDAMTEHESMVRIGDSPIFIKQ